MHANLASSLANHVCVTEHVTITPRTGPSLHFEKIQMLVAVRKEVILNGDPKVREGFIPKYLAEISHDIVGERSLAASSSYHLP